MRYGKIQCRPLHFFFYKKKTVFYRFLTDKSKSATWMSSRTDNTTKKKRSVINSNMNLSFLIKPNKEK